MISDAIKSIDWAGTAYCLTGHICKVYFREPARKGLEGLHYRVKNHSVIELSPRVVNPDAMLMLFLHECGHARLHFDDLKIHQSEPQPLSRPKHSEGHWQSPKITRREDDAERLARKWYKFCRPQTTLEGKHRVLRSYYDV